MATSDIRESGKAEQRSEAALLRAGGLHEVAEAHGRFLVECFDRDGRLKWRDTIENLITTVGKNLVLDTSLAGSGYTVTGPFMGLISSVGYTTGPAAGDTMVSHGGWAEAGLANAPTYTAPRKTCVWSAAAAGAKALSVALVFFFTGTGTVKGCFLVFGLGAVSTIDDTGGTPYSAGLFTGGDRAVVATDTMHVSYSASL